MKKTNKFAPFFIVGFMLLIGAGCDQEKEMHIFDTAKGEQQVQESQKESLPPVNVALEVKSEKNVKKIVSSENANTNRTLILRNEVDKFRNQLPDPCEFQKIEELTFSSDRETEWSLYKNKEKGIEVSIPYNPDWGAPAFRLNPYDEYNNGVSFGTILSSGEGCGSWVNGVQRLDFIPAQTRQETLERLEKESDQSEYGYTIKVFTIDDKEVVEYSGNALCGGGGTIIIGKKYNYKFSTICFANTRDDIIKTIKFID